jgi:hypothetical protein
VSVERGARLCQLSGAVPPGARLAAVVTRKHHERLVLDAQLSVGARDVADALVYPRPWRLNIS